MVFGLFKKKENKNPILDEINKIKEKVVQNENEFKSFENTFMDEMKRVYSYISGMHADIDALGEVVQELKEDVGSVSVEKIELMERKINDLDENMKYVRMIGKLALKNYDRIDRLEAKVDEVMHALDSLVFEIRESKQVADVGEAVIEKKPTPKPKKAVAVGQTASKTTALEEKTASQENAGKIKTKTKINKNKSGATMNYLMELERLRKELLELKALKQKT